MELNLIRSNKNRTLIKSIVILILAISIFSIYQFFIDNTAYAVMLDGNQIGFVEETQIAQEAFDTAKVLIEKQLGKKVQVNSKLEYESIQAVKNHLIEPKDMVNAIQSQILSKPENYKVEAYEISITDGPRIIVDDTKIGELILNQIKMSYIPENNSDIFQTAEFVEEIRKTTKFVSVNEVIAEQQARRILSELRQEEKKYKVKKGDSLSQIAIDQDIAMDELLDLNPEINEDSILQINQELQVIRSKPILSVRTEEQIIFTEEIKKSFEYQEDSEQYKDYRKIIQEGKNGIKEVTANIVKINGKIEDKKFVSEKVIEEPQTEIVVIGTKPLPPKRAKGNFIRPLNGRLTSGFGPRWGTTHTGIDLAAPTGTAIKASDGGTIIFARWGGTYGNLVKIDHGNGFVTYYAHASKLYVSEGQKVAQGEVIAAVGSTGDSTGPHLHFEVRKNGSSVNPYNYMK